jgi:hypothetical protein
VAVGPSVPPVVWCVLLCRRILADRMSHHGECMRDVYVPLVVRRPRVGCIGGLERQVAVGGDPRGSVVGFVLAGVCCKQCRCFAGCGSPAGVGLFLYVRYSCTFGNIRKMKLGVVSVVEWVFG